METGKISLIFLAQMIVLLTSLPFEHFSSKYYSRVSI